MCNTMASMIIILISIASIAAITEEAVINDSNTDLNNVSADIDKLLETLPRRNLQTTIVPKYNGLDVWMMLQLRPRLDPLQTLWRPIETAKAEPITSQHDACRRNRRKIDGKIISGDGGSSSVASLTSSSSPSNVNDDDVYPVSVENWILQQLKIEEMNRIRKPSLINRRRRSASGAEISSGKNTKASADPTPSYDGHSMSAIKCLLSLSYPVSLPTQCIQFYFRNLFKAIH